MADYIELERGFWPVEADAEKDPESIPALFASGFDGELSWVDLLAKPRVVILAEPGTGKTEELRAVTKRLRTAHKSAFFCKIELLQSLDVRQSFDIGTSAEFDEWLAEDEEGFFFLDSVDEAKMHSHSAFEIALRRFAGALGESLRRAKVVMTCRVSNWRATADLSLFSSYLPMPEIMTVREDEGIPAGEGGLDYGEAVRDGKSIDREERKDHVVFQLTPLNQQQIRRFAAEIGIGNTNDFLEAIERADAMIFAERPQDLLELIAFWKSKGRLGRHFEMLDFNIQVKLAEHDPDRVARKPLSPDDAVLGAERLAAASTLQKKNAVILPDRPIDTDLRDASIDPKAVLPDWSSDRIQTLLNRPIFDEAIYGTVRFHHRSVREYLTARWLKRLLDLGKSRRSIEGLVFASRYGREVVIPSMRPIAAWLAIWDERVLNHLRSVAPEVLIENGDPATLPVEFRKSLLVGFAELYAERRYTGTSFDITMLRRLADPQLATTIKGLLRKYTTHDDVCTLLLKLIWLGQFAACADVALSCAISDQSNQYTRVYAIRAVVAAGTPEQHRYLVNALLADKSRLPSIVIAEVCDAFFPKIVSTEQLLDIIETADTPEQYATSQLERSLEAIAQRPIADDVTEKLTRGLHNLLKRAPFIEQTSCEISGRYAWVLPSVLRIVNQLIRKKHPFSYDPIAFDLFLAFFAAQHYSHFLPSEREEVLEAAKIWPEFRLQLFWHAIATSRAREIDRDSQIVHWWQARWAIQDFWMPGAEDLDQLFAALSGRPLTDDRLVALTAIFEIYIQGGRLRPLRERMKRAMAGVPELGIKLQELLHPQPLSAEQRELRQKLRDSKRRQAAREKRQKNNRRKSQQALKKIAGELKNVGDAQKGEVWRRSAYLYDRLREKKGESEHFLGYSNWRALIGEFGHDVVKNFRDGCVAYWREYDPFAHPNRPN